MSSSVVGAGERLHLRLFLERQEVPVVAASVSAGMNAPAAAQIEVVPTDAALRLLPRTMVHLFYWENGLAAYGTPGTGERGSARRRIATKSDGAYRLLFCGEIFDLIYTKTAEGTRSLILNCQDFSNLWDTTYLYYLRFAPQDPGQRSALAGARRNFLGSPEVFDDLPGGSPLSWVANRLSTGKSVTSPALAGASNTLGGLLSVIELIGGVHGKTVGLYDWATVEERRVRTMDQIATDDGATAKALYATTTLENWLKGRLGDMGEVISFRQLITAINGFIYYEVAANPVGVYTGKTRIPPYYPAEEGGWAATEQDPDLVWSFPIIERVMRDLGTPAVRGSALRTAEEADANGSPNSMHRFGLAQDWVMAGGGVGYHYVPERSSSIWRRAYKIVSANPGISKSDLYSRLDAAAAGSGKLLDKQVQFWKNLKTAVDTVNAQADSEGRGSRRLKSGQDFSKEDPVLTLISGGSVKGDPVHVELEDAGARREQLLAAHSEDGPVSATSKAPLQRLQTQFFRPDVWFVVPPACNVIYPEECSSFTFRRQMMHEVTRLELDTFNTLYSEGQVLLQRAYFAPVSEATDSLSTAGGGIGQAVKPLVYPHEIYSGLIPKLEYISDASFHAKLNELYGKGVTDVEAENEIDRMSARAAFFHFMSYRYAARTMSASCRFLPRLVVGFPGLVVDRPSGTAAGVIPTHFLGMITTLQHSVSQGGGQTVVAFSHARSHRTSQNDLDDLFSRTLYGNGQLFADQATGEVRTSIDLKAVLGTQPLYIQSDAKTGRWILAPAEEAAPSIPATSDSVTGEEIPAVGAPTSPTLELDEGTRNAVLFAMQWVSEHVRGESTLRIGKQEIPENLIGPKGKRIGAIELRGVLGAADADPNLQQIQFTHLTVFEYDNGVLPLEEALRPPWFSEQYSNAKIGEEIYKPFFGTTSLLELSNPPAASLEAAVDKLVDTYSAIAKAGPVPGHIWFTTYREGASLPDTLTAPPTGEGAEGAGFHYFAAGEFTGLKYLDLLDGVNQEGQALTMDKNDLAGNKYLLQSAIPGRELRPVDPAIDPRAGRYAVVRAYLAELLGARAFRG